MERVRAILRLVGALIFSVPAILQIIKKILEFIGFSTAPEDAIGLFDKLTSLPLWLTFSLAFASWATFLFWPELSKSAENLRLMTSERGNAEPDAEETEKLDIGAYNSLINFWMDYLRPSCELQIELQEMLIRKMCSSGLVADFAVEGFKNDWRFKTREFWEHYNGLSALLLESPKPDVTIETFQGMIRRDVRFGELHRLRPHRWGTSIPVLSEG